MPLLVLFILIPIIEIGLFIQVGGWLGLWPTLAIVVLTAIIGTSLLRAQGLATLARLQGSLQDGKNPVDPMVHGALILVAGILLLTPGFFTDAVGFALLLPPMRAMLVKWGAARFMKSSKVVFTTQSSGFEQRGPQENRRSGDALEGDFVVLDDDDDATPGNSGWTKKK